MSGASMIAKGIRPFRNADARLCPGPAMGWLVE
jgi:hypothetical protein